MYRWIKEGRLTIAATPSMQLTEMSLAAAAEKLASASDVLSSLSCRTKDNHNVLQNSTLHSRLRPRRLCNSIWWKIGLQMSLKIQSFATSTETVLTSSQTLQERTLRSSPLMLRLLSAKTAVVRFGLESSKPNLRGTPYCRKNK